MSLASVYFFCALEKLIFHSLSATFKIIKTLLPAKAVARMKFVNSKTLNEFVDESNMLTIWGGNDNYSYEFVDEEETPTRSINNNNVSSGRKVRKSI